MILCLLGYGFGACSRRKRHKRAIERRGQPSTSIRVQLQSSTGRMEGLGNTGRSAIYATTAPAPAVGCQLFTVSEECVLSWTAVASVETLVLPKQPPQYAAVFWACIATTVSKSGTRGDRVPCGCTMQDMSQTGLPMLRWLYSYVCCRTDCVALFCSVHYAPSMGYLHCTGYLWIHLKCDNTACHVENARQHCRV